MLARRRSPIAPSAETAAQAVNNIHGTATLTNCTISGNSSSGVAGVYNSNYSAATLTDTIVAGNTGPHRLPATSAVRRVSLGSHNLIGTGGSGGLVNGQNGNIVLTSLSSLGLAPLGFYGGPTQTMALSPAAPPSARARRQRRHDRPARLRAGQAHRHRRLPDPALDRWWSTRRPMAAAPVGRADLREAVNLANVLAGAQTITFDPTVFATAQTITLDGGPARAERDRRPETITGPAAGVTDQRRGQSGVFQVDADVTAALSGLTITGGSQRQRRRRGQLGHGDTHRLHHQRKLRGRHGGGVNDCLSRHGDSHRLHHQRKLRTRGGGLTTLWPARPRSPTAPSAETPRTLAAVNLWHGHAHRLHRQRKLGTRRRRTWTTSPRRRSRHDRRRQYRTCRRQRHRRVRQGHRELIT